MMLQNDHYHVLICDNSNQKHLKILTRSDNRLPVVEWDGYFSKDINVLCKKVADGVNAEFDLAFLRIECEYQYRPDKAWFTPGLIIFETISNETPDPPDEHKWLSHESADEVEVHPRTESVIRYLNEFKGLGLEVNSQRLHPFSRGGWFKEAKEWLRKALAEAGHDITSVIQFTSGYEASILVAETGSGSKFYMKALPLRAYNDEVAVTCTLAAVIPEMFSKPLFVNRKKGWIVMRDHGPSLSPSMCSMEENPDLVKQVLCEWAKVQKRSIAVVEKLSQSGIPLYDDNRYKERVKEVLNSSVYVDALWENMTKNEKGNYEKEGYKREVFAYVERLFGLILQYKVPLTVVHGDLNPLNVIPDESGNSTFIDFAYTSISFPFLDALSFWFTCGGEDESLDFYLEFWTEFESMERLRELLDLVRELERVENLLLSFHFYEKADAGQLCSARTEISGLSCSRFSRYK